MPMSMPMMLCHAMKAVEPRRIMKGVEPHRIMKGVEPHRVVKGVVRHITTGRQATKGVMLHPRVLPVHPPSARLKGVE